MGQSLASRVVHAQSLTLTATSRDNSLLCCEGVVPDTQDSNFTAGTFVGMLQQEILSKISSGPHGLRGHTASTAGTHLKRRRLRGVQRSRSSRGQVHVLAHRRTEPCGFKAFYQSQPLTLLQTLHPKEGRSRCRRPQGIDISPKSVSRTVGTLPVPDYFEIRWP